MIYYIHSGGNVRAEKDLRDDYAYFTGDEALDNYEAWKTAMLQTGFLTARDMSVEEIALMNKPGYAALQYMSEHHCSLSEARVYTRQFSCPTPLS